jgi:hypothetical protein
MTVSFLVGKIFITISTIIYGFVPLFVDLNKTHATNPLWTGHSRFHVVWQVMITFCIATLSLYFLWVRHYETENGVISFILGLSVLGSFLLNVLVMKFYGGALADKNGVSKTFNINSNLLGFTIALVILISGFLMISF